MSTNISELIPFAEVSRPDSPNDFIGQRHLWGPNATLRRLAENDRFSSLVFCGPPGTGKTSLARLIAKMSKRQFFEVSAVMSGVKELREIILNGQRQKQLGEKVPLMFVDEVHHFNKTQQDILLPALEQGWIKFIGATTENPSFSLNSGILSRTLVFRFQPFSRDEIFLLLKQALAKAGNSLPRQDFSDNSLCALISLAPHDGRRALSLLEAAASSIPAEIPLDAEQINSFKHHLVIYHDKSGDRHYDLISALIKSMRASDPDAAIYYLARMLVGGDDPVFIARRLTIFAAEDVGNANPLAMVVASNCLQATHAVGMPEARIILAQVVAYLALSVKSNSAYQAIEKAWKLVEDYGELKVPNHLTNAPTKLMAEEGKGLGYINPHTHPEAAMAQTNLPDQIGKIKIY